MSQLPCPAAIGLFAVSALLSACAGAPDVFDKPTDVAVASNGDVYVSDGYGNSRVARFDANGAFLQEWGEKGREPGQFDIPHGLAFDAEGRLYVADRKNARIQLFDAEGALLDVWSGPEIGRPWAVAVGPKGHLFVSDGGDQIEDHPFGRAVELDREGHVLATFGSFGHGAGQFDTGHDISVGQDGSVYVVEQVGKRIQKFRPIGNP